MGVDAQMFIRTRETITEERLKILSWQICESFGSTWFLVSRPGEWSWLPEGRRALTLCERYEQDGPDILPEPGESFVEVHLSCRYYGPQYERGPLPIILAIARWLRSHIHGEVWYGGDSSGFCAEPMIDDALWGHFAEVGHRPYVGYFNRASIMLCDWCDAPINFNIYLGSEKTERGTCPACGQMFERAVGAATCRHLTQAEMDAERKRWDR